MSDEIRTGAERVKDITSEKADQILESGPDWLCTLHRKLRVPCDDTCGVCDDWQKEHEQCQYRIHKTEIVFGRIFGKGEGWVRKAP